MLQERHERTKDFGELSSSLSLRAEGSRAARRHAGKSIWPFVGFLALFCALLVLVTKLYLLRALADFNAADARGKKVIGLHATLVMSLLLVILGCSMVLLFRIGRYFFPPRTKPPTKTQYTDAWTEAGKRMKTPEK